VNGRTQFLKTLCCVIDDRVSNGCGKNAPWPIRERPLITLAPWRGTGVLEISTYAHVGEENTFLHELVVLVKIEDIISELFMSPSFSTFSLIILWLSNFSQRRNRYMKSSDFLAVARDEGLALTGKKRTGTRSIPEKKKQRLELICQQPPTSCWT